MISQTSRRQERILNFDDVIRVIHQPEFGAFTYDGSAEMTHFIFLKI